MSTTLQELKSQISAANQLGVTNITKKGGTISSDATTAEIMAEIDNLPSGGGAAPTVVTEITWDGDTTGLESYDVMVDGEVAFTLYRVKENEVLPVLWTIDSSYTGCSTVPIVATIGEDTNVEPEAIYIGNYAIFGSFKPESIFFCAMCDNAQLDIEELVLSVPHAGTWCTNMEGTYISKLTATDTAISYIQDT